jgi:hypothetical protein
MIKKGKVSAVLDGGRLVTITPLSGGIVTAPLVVPFFLIGAVPVNTSVIYTVFDDNTGIVLARSDGAGNGG